MLEAVLDHVASFADERKDRNLGRSRGRIGRAVARTSTDRTGGWQRPVVGSQREDSQRSERTFSSASALLRPVAEAWRSQPFSAMARL